MKEEIRRRLKKVMEKTWTKLSKIAKKKKNNGRTKEGKIYLLPGTQMIENM